MAIPVLTHLQFLILREIRNGEKKGSVLRVILKQNEIMSSRVSFYRLMGRLNESDMIATRYETTQTSECQVVTIAHYSITATGRKALDEVLAFYAKGPA